MECENARDNLTDHLAGNLPEALKGEIEEHFASCPSCQMEAHTLGSMWTKMGSVAIEPPDADAMWSRFESLLHSDPVVKRSGIRSWFLRPAFQMGFAVLLILLGVAIGRGRLFSAVSPTAPDMDQMRVELREMKEMLVLSLMQQQSATERLRGVSWSNQIAQPDSPVLSALFGTLMHDPNVNVRLACVSALEKFGEEQMVRRGLVEALSRQDSPLVQAALIDAVVALRETESVDTLRKLTVDESVDEGVRKLAKRALEQLS